MTIGITSLDHVNVTVPPDREEEAKKFYENVLGLKRVDKPAGSRQSMGAWYQLEHCQIHLSVEESAQQLSERHFCVKVAAIDAAQQQFRDAGIEMIPDERPIAGRSRFYVRDPGGNLIEVAQDDRRPATDDR